MKIKTKILLTLPGRSLLVPLVSALAVNQARAFTGVAVTKEVPEQFLAQVFGNGAERQKQESTRD